MHIEQNLSPDKIADYILAKDASRDDSDVTQMKLHKLLYFAQANYLASTGERLFDASIEAFQHGPIVEALRRRFERFGRNIIVVEDPEQSRFSTGEIPAEIADYLDQIWDQLGELSASQLRALSHRDAPWKNNYSPDLNHALIPDAEIQEYYQTLTDHRRIYPAHIFVLDENIQSPQMEAEFLAAWAGWKP